jgi:tRNA G46 methylase TrmB
MIYQFFHEGNPSTQVNKIITKTKNLYLKINLEIAMRRGDMLQEIATNNWAEYFIGIGKDQNEVLKAKSRFADLDPPNASAFWGDTHKLLLNILDKSIDNFLMVLPQKLVSFTNTEGKVSLMSLLATIPAKLAAGGTLQLLTDVEVNSVVFNDLLKIILDNGFQVDAQKARKIYFPRGWKDADFIEGRIPQVIIFSLKQA